MRSFFKSELQTLYAKTQFRQLETLSAMPEPEKQISAMLDALVRVCEYYSYIPDEAKKAIILDRMLKDDDFIGFNAKIISKWFEQVKGKYFTEEAHKKPGNESNAAAITYDQFSPELKESFDNFLRALQSDNAGFKRVPEVSQKEIDSIKLEDLESQEGKRASGYIPNPELAILHEKKIQWIRETHDPVSGKAFEGSLSFDEWLKSDSGGTLERH